MIRPGILADIPDIIELGLHVLTNSAYQLAPNVDKAAAKFKQAIKNPNMFCVVAENQTGDVVGVLVINMSESWLSDDHTAHDAVFYIHPSYVNKAPFMIKRALSWVSARPSIKQFHLGITSGYANTTRTGQLYQRLGFSQVGENYLKIMR